MLHRLVVRAELESIDQEIVDVNVRYLIFKF